ncbi:MAG TPA: NAD-dependent protein deacetylase [Polyangiaceae bacterium]|jgi:NAD-dependent SIR2 family protein deacetylase|nr:NAD-dependent protein deacetylase [Polyangiaceae bacterium]
MPLVSRDRAPPARELSRRLERHSSWFVLTGAGCSTESGIPAYRDETGAWRHKAPIQLGEFLGSEHVRRRYWARSFSGFQRVQQAQPNPAHHALAALERLDRVRLLVTQNVDRLHQKAGSRNVIDLHGQLAWVVCLGCGAQFERTRVQSWLEQQNPELSADEGLGAGAPAQRALGFAPDGDAEVGGNAVASVRIPACPSCSGMLKPAVVFFGETVPPEKVQASYTALEAADALLVVGSSLTVFSGYRFVRRAADLGKPIVVLNSGVTRGDRFAELKLEGSCGALLSAALELLGAEGTEG